MSNVLVLSGNLGKDPETKTFQNAKGESKLCSFTLAHRLVGKKGLDGKDATMWVDVTVFGKTAEFVQNYLKKGSFAVVTGKLTEDTFTDKQTGQPRSIKKMVGDSVDSPNLGSGGNSGGNGSYSAQPIDDSAIPF